MNKKLYNKIIEGNVHYFYTSWTWRKKRKQILMRDNNECQECKKRGKFNKATTVHHIKHLKDRPDLALSDKNLLSVCDSCHNDLHPEKLEKMIKEEKKKGFVNEERW